MGAVVGIRDSIKRLGPPWFGRGVAEKIFYAIGLAQDVGIQNMFEGARSRCPGSEGCQPEALPVLGADRVLERYPNEPAPTYASRLSQAWDAWAHAGSALTVLQQIINYCQPFVPVVRVASTNTTNALWQTVADGVNRVRTIANPSNWNWDGQASAWWRVWPIIYPPATVWTVGPTWGTGTTWGASGRTWGTSATSSQVAAIRALVKKWKPAHINVPWVVIAFDSTKFNPSVAAGDSHNPDGNWYHWSKVQTSGAVAARDATARYWDEVS